jgi:hypothetical protein
MLDSCSEGGRTTRNGLVKELAPWQRVSQVVNQTSHLGVAEIDACFPIINH